MRGRSPTHLASATWSKAASGAWANACACNAALVERASGANRWSNSYETSGDLFAIEDDIGRQVLTALELVLDIKAGAGPAPPRGADDASASYDVYLRGLSSLRKPRSARTLDEAERLFQRALAEQPGFARAQAGLCQARVERYLLERVPAHVTDAEKACARARPSTTPHTKFTRPSATCGS